MIDPQKRPGKEWKRLLLAGWISGSEILIKFEKHPIFKPQTVCSNKRSPSGPPNSGQRK